MKRIFTLCLVLCLMLIICMPCSAEELAVPGRYSRINIQGSETYAVIDSNGGLWMWGQNQCGQVGDGSMDPINPSCSEEEMNVLTPVKVLDNVLSVCSTGVNTVALKKDGTLWGWGANWSNVLGAGTQVEYVLKPQRIPLVEDVISFSAGAQNIAVVKRDGSLWMWGHNACGQLLVDPYAVNETYTPVKLMENVSAVNIGGQTVAVLKKDNSLWMWGDNYEGQVGAGLFQQKIWTPQHILDDVRGIAVSPENTAAVKLDGTVWFWGANWHGQAGTMPSSIEDPSSELFAPVQVPNVTNAVELGLGHYHLGVIQEDGILLMWGWDQVGQVSGHAYLDRVYSDGCDPERNESEIENYITPIVPSGLEDIEFSALSCGISSTLALAEDGTIYAFGDGLYGLYGNGESSYDLCVNPVVVTADRMNMIPPTHDTHSGYSSVTYQITMPAETIHLFLASYDSTGVLKSIRIEKINRHTGGSFLFKGDSDLNYRGFLLNENLQPVGRVFVRTPTR